MDAPPTITGFTRIREPQQERSRRAFLDALDAFDQLLRGQPLAAVTVQDVADTAHLSITSVYARFDGKAALVLALHERTIAIGAARLAAAINDGDLAMASLEAVVAEIIRQAVAFGDEYGHVFRAMVAAADEETNQRAAAFIAEGAEQLAALVGPRLTSPPDEVERNVDFAWRSTVAVLQQRWVLWGTNPGRFRLGSDELVDRLTRSFLLNIGPGRAEA